MAQGKLKQAAEHLEQIRRQGPGQHLAPFAWAELLWERGERAAAVDAQHEALGALHTTHSAWPAQRRALRRMKAELSRKR